MKKITLLITTMIVLAALLSAAAKIADSQDTATLGPGKRIQIPRIDEGEGWGTRIQAQNVGDAQTGVITLFWGDYSSECLSNAPGPMDHLCHPALDSWGVLAVEAEIPAGAESAILYSVSSDLYQAACEAAGSIDSHEAWKDWEDTYAYSGESLAVTVNRTASNGSLASGMYNGFSETMLGSASPYHYFVPSIMHGYNGLDSTITIQNSGRDCTSIWLYYREEGNCEFMKAQHIELLAPGEAIRIGPGADADMSFPSPELDAPWLGSVHITAGEPLAIVVDQWDADSTMLLTYAGVPKDYGATANYAPLVYRDLDGWNAEIYVQNLTLESQRTFVTVNFFDQSGDEIFFVGDWVCPNGTYTVYLSDIGELGVNFVGTAEIESHDRVEYPGDPHPGEPIASVVSLINGDGSQALSYNAHTSQQIAGVTTFALPRVSKQSQGVTSRIALRNNSNCNKFDGEILFKDEAGAITATIPVPWIHPRHLKIIDLASCEQLAPGFIGAATFEVLDVEQLCMDDEPIMPSVVVLHLDPDGSASGQEALPIPVSTPTPTPTTTSTPTPTPTATATPTPTNPGEPNDTCATATFLPVGTLLSATLHNPDDVDFFTFDVAQPNTTILATLNHPDQDYDLALYDTCTDPIGEACHVGRARHVGEESLAFNVGPNVGTYYLAIVGYDGAFSATPYTLQVDLNPDSDEPNDLCPDAIELTPDTPHSSYLSHPSDVDFYKVYVDQEYAILTVRLNHPEQDYDLTLYDACPAAVGQARHVGRARHMGEEVLNYNVGPNPGWYFILANGFDGAYSTTPYTIEATLVPPGPFGTLILTHRQRLTDRYDDTAVSVLFDQLDDLVAHASVAGFLLDVADAPDVSAAYAAWDANPRNPARANDVAAAIKELIQESLQQCPTIRYLVIVGGDAIIPFYRVPIRPYQSGPDPSWTTENAYLYATGGTWNEDDPTVAALRNNLTLTDDFYGSDEGISFQDHRLYIPNRPVGRLVETPEEIGGIVAAFLDADGVARPDQALAVGGDFIADAASVACDLLTADGLLATCQTDNAWDSSWLRSQLLDVPPDLATVNYHANHFSFGAPAGGELTASDVADASASLDGLILYTLGCQTGLNVSPGNPEALDLPQALAGRGAALIGNTGWGYGIVDGFGLSESLIELFTEALVSGNGTTLGDALMEAKRTYYLTENQLDHYDEKVLTELVLYGLPMLRVLTPAGATTTGMVGWPNWMGLDSATEQEARVVQSLEQLQAGPAREERRIWFGEDDVEQQTTSWGSYYTYRGDAQADPGLPLQPRYVASTFATSGPVHGMALVGGTYTDHWCQLKL